MIVVSDPSEERREAAKAVRGHPRARPRRRPTCRSPCLELTGGIGVDYAFESAGQASLLETGIAATRPGGTTVGVGAPPIDQSITLHGVVGFTAMEKKLIGCLLGSSDSHREIPRLLNLWKAGRLDLEGMITSRRPLDELPAALDDMKARKGIRTVLQVG